MQFFLDLWLPILLSGVFVFIASSLHHMVLRLHQDDFAPLPDEAGLLAALREHGVRPGAYQFPFCHSKKELGSPELEDKYTRGPVGHMIVRPNGMIPLGRALAQWFAFTLVVGTIVAYLTALTVAKGVPFLGVFRVAGTAALLGYGVYAVQDSIWKAQRWSVTLRFLFDGLAYALITGATFGWLWPS